MSLLGIHVSETKQIFLQLVALIAQLHRIEEQWWDNAAELARFYDVSSLLKLYGCDFANTTVFGFGERTGNPPLEGAIFEYIALKGDLCGIDTTVITELAEYMRSIGLPIPDNYPFVGRSFNTTRAGIHAGGLRRDERIYNIFDTTKLLNRPPRVAITDKSGADGVAHWVNEYLGLKGDQRISKIKIHKLARWVIDQYEKEGRLTAISDQEMEQKAQELLPQYCKK